LLAPYLGQIKNSGCMIENTVIFLQNAVRISGLIAPKLPTSDKITIISALQTGGLSS
jgi:hypothetical protein